MRATPWLRLPCGWRVRLELKRTHLYARLDIWVCILPCLPIHVCGDWIPRRLRGVDELLRQMHEKARP